ncbi:MAG TPA: aminobutyraldehyde dehydrogenase [archaeon]|nr:aminobutyraldehyde dehydrogenase [archaeon]
MMQKYKMYIDGKWAASESGKTFDVINPATEKVIAKVPLGDARDAKKAIAAARKTFDRGEWSRMTVGERASYIWKLADLLEKNSARIAKIESMNVGKTIKYSLQSDMPFIVDNLRFFAGACRTLEGKAAAEYVDFSAHGHHVGLGTSIIRREPIGVVGCIVPWNYPLYVAIWQIAPALAAGNCVVVKPASYTPLTLLEFAKLVEEVGIAKGVFNVVTGPGEIIGKEFATNPQVDMISLTGDTSTGREIMKQASSTVKRLHLELGGKAPLIILEDADLDAATKGAVVATVWNSGQDCTAATRVYVPEKLHDRFVKLLVAEMRKVRIGDPMKKHVDLGPMISERQRGRVEAYIKSGIQQGAKLVYGGKRIGNKGFFMQPAIFTNVKQNMRICQEEIFGPVLSVIKYKTLDEAIQKANDVVYGLASSVWGKDIAKLMKVANSLKFGTVWINEHGVLASEMPHGGYKQSGFGKDMSLYSFEEYTNVKHIYIDISGMARKPWHCVVYGEP